MLNLKTGQEVLYKNEKWNVLYVWRNSENVVVRITLGGLKFTDIDGEGTTWGLKRVDASPEEISECKHELTAKECAEKLKAVLGYDNCKNIDGAEPEDEVCAGLDLCEKCPFCFENREAVFEGGCEALMLYHPDLAVKLMDEWQAEKNKPKGKTYLQDFVEKLPRTAIGQGGIPFVCLKNVYGEEAAADDVCKAGDCKKCWGQKMPEEDNAEG